MAILLGLASAIAFGVSDYLAGVLSRRLHFTLVGLISQASATALAWASLPWTGGPRPAMAALAWGALSGIGGGVGSLALYRGLGRGRMSVVGPLSAVGAAALPALAGLALGDRPSPVAIGGVLLALPAIWLVAAPAGETGGERPAGPSGIGDGLLAGAGFGLLFIGLARAGDGAGLWPVAMGQLTALVLLTVVVGARLAVTRPALPGGPRALLAPLIVGCLSVTATLLYFLATHSGLLTIVAVLASLYPGVTVLLAWLLLGERVTRVQRAGLALCAVAVAAIAAV
jgi:uncharacterized membrane protein